MIILYIIRKFDEKNKYCYQCLWHWQTLSCKTLKICGIKFSRFDKNDILTHFNFGIHDLPSLQILKKKKDENLLHFFYLFYSILSHNLGRSSGHHRWICNNPFPSWPVFSCPSWAGKVHSCPLFDIVFPPLLLSASFSFSFHCAL